MDKDITSDNWPGISAAIRRGIELAELHNVAVIRVDPNGAVVNGETAPLVQIALDDDDVDALHRFGGVWTNRHLSPTTVHLTHEAAGCLFVTVSAHPDVLGVHRVTRSYDWAPQG